MTQQILVVSSLNSIAPANYLIDAFQNLGIEVIAISDVANERANDLASGAFDVKKYIDKNNLCPDLLLFVEGGEMGILPINFTNLNFPKFWWGIDTPHDYSKHLRISRLFDHTFLAQKSYVEEMRRDGIQSVSWLPLAYGGQAPTSDERSIDIAYVGSVDWILYPERKEYLSQIQENFNNIYIGTCAPAEMYSIYRNSKIVFNYSFKNDVNMRIFEALGSGALLMTNKIVNNGIEDILNQGEEFIEYSDPKNLIQKINFFLSHMDDLQRISSEGMRRVINDHSYLNRAGEIAGFTTKNRKSTANETDFAAALLSLGLLSGALQQFLVALQHRSVGRKNMLIMLFLSLCFRPAISFTKILELIAIRLRRRKW